MASPNPAQTRIMTIVSCIALLVLSAVALGFVVWGIRRIMARTGQRKALLDDEAGRGTAQRSTPIGKEDTGSIPSSGVSDPFQTPTETQVSPTNHPEWAVQYQKYLESRNRMKKTSSAASTKSAVKVRVAPQISYPRGLGILMDPEESAYLADNEGTASLQVRGPLTVSRQPSRDRKILLEASLSVQAQSTSPFTRGVRSNAGEHSRGKRPVDEPRQSN